MTGIALEQIRALTQRAHQTPGYPDLWMQLGRLLAHERRAEEALVALDTALEINPTYRDAVLLHCVLLSETGRTAEALQQFRRCESEDLSFLLTLGGVCMDQGLHHAGAHMLTRAAVLRPQVSYIQRYAAMAHEVVGNLPTASAYYEKADHLERMLPGWVVLSGSALQRTLCSEWRGLALARVHASLASFARQTERPEIAEAQIIHGLDQFPGHPDLMVEYGHLAQHRCQPERAREWWEAALKVDDTCHAACIELGFLSAANEEIDRAEQCFQAAVRLRPLYADYRYHLGVLLRETGRLEEACDELFLACQINPDYAQAQLQLAGVLVDLGRCQKALETIEASSCKDWPEARDLVLAAQGLLAEPR